MTRRLAHDAYNRLHNLIGAEFKGKMDRTHYTDFDVFFINVCGWDLSSVNSSDAIRFALAMSDGKIDAEWLWGPHAYTILKAKIARDPKLQKWFDYVEKETS